MRTIAIVNHKGGVGKTTTALGLSVGLARRLRKGRRLLFIDGDAQGNATSTLLDGKSPNKPTLTQVLLDDADASEAIRPSRYPGVDLLPADPSLADCTVWLADQIGREQRLRTALQSVADPYDQIIIDAPPAMSLVTVNVLHAVEELLVPVDAGAYAVMGLARLQETVDKIRKHLAHPELQIIGLVLTRVMKNRPTRELEAIARHVRQAGIHERYPIRRPGRGRRRSSSNRFGICPEVTGRGGIRGPDYGGLGEPWPQEGQCPPV